MKTPRLVSLFLLFVSIQSFAIIRYVTPLGAGTQDGSSWTNAFPGTQLQDAIDASVPGDEVWVRAGTYFTTTTNDRNEWFSMRNGVAIYGSFAGTETSLAQRSFSCGFSSVLSGEIGVAGMADNSYHIFNNSSLNTTAILDGFTIRDANANFDLVGNDNRSLGGGMLNNGQNGGTCTPTIRNCWFTQNSALFGGGIFDHGQNGGNASPVIINCIFTNNNATGGGGAIDNFGYNGNASPAITNCLFYANTATDRAGAMYCWGGGGGNASPVILNSIFINNSSVDGGAIVCDRLNFSSGSSGTATPNVRNSIFWGNTASGTGPQFITFGGASFTATYTLIDITNQLAPHTISGPGTGNIFTAPAFVDVANPVGNDNCWLTTDDGLQLQLSSQGVDDGNNTGVPATDIRGYARISNGIVDLGAYEFNAVVVPVSLHAFYGTQAGNSNRLYWKTSQEQNSLRFDIERSVNGFVFDKIGELPAAGNSDQLLQYQFTDNNLSHPGYYYRIKQVDQNLRMVQSPVILLKPSGNIPITLFPNPVRDRATVVFGKPVSGETFYLANSDGKMLMKYNWSGSATTLDMTGFPEGVYLLFNNRGVVLKFRKLRD